ncbi:tetratricopeptide repeat protein [Roseicyclus persicicus]|uniref:Tetratricopeptide repeat protein n=1 Tax=Roseicyclus persicicus TaxID=2650661 RepID=A0A7X6JY54_9RHOB|nr:tetratricopeptide repeat protein [Roseibacterium persicicum]NKX45450.1 tetratricopeptide repeat protein [Roseibacterium persicicum]
MAKDSGDEPDPGQVAGALRDLAAWLEGADGDAGWLAALRFGVAGGLAQAGEGALAEGAYRRLLQDNPSHLWAWVALIDLAMARGDAPAAAAAGRDGLERLPVVALLRRKTAEAVEAAEGPGPAVAVLTAAGEDALAPDDVPYAIGLHRAARSVTAASALCDRLLAERPADPLAHLARIEAALERGDAAAARAAAEAALPHQPDHPEILLRAAQAHRQAGDRAGAAQIARRAPPDTPFEAELQALRAGDGPDAAPAEAPPDPGTLLPDLDAALAEEGPDRAEALLRRVLAWPDLPWYLAFRLVERAWAQGAAALADRLSAAFDGAAWGAADRQAFAIEDALLRQGPLAALDWVRANPAPRRDTEAAERLGRVLLGAGTGALAARYLRACCRRWPGDAALFRLATEALIVSGRAAEVPALVAGAAAAVPAEHRLAGAVSAALAAGDIAEARALCDRAEAEAMGALPAVEMIEVQLLAGDRAAAEASFARLSPEDGPLVEALICRPRATRVGTLLNEARIVDAGGPDWTRADPADLRRLAREFFLPARALLDRHGAGGALPAAASDPVPEIIHLVWPGAAPRPDEAARLVAAWRGASRRELRAHDPGQAAAWLRDSQPPEVARAHALAPDAEQKADILRLALLLAEGGAAVSGDLWPAGPVDPLLDAGPGARLYRDGGGAISTELILAPPAHPVIRLALDMAVASCLARENDHRWFKTGPGLLTRALAASLDAGPDLQVGTLDEVRRVIHPCRISTGRAALPARDRSGSAYVSALGRLFAEAP